MHQKFWFAMEMMFFHHLSDQKLHLLTLSAFAPKFIFSWMKGLPMWEGRRSGCCESCEGSAWDRGLAAVAYAAVAYAGFHSHLFPYIPPLVRLGLCLYYKVAEAGSSAPAGGLCNPEALQQYPCSMAMWHELENQIVGQTEDAQKSVF